jgi:hypothetical protein
MDELTSWKNECGGNEKAREPTHPGAFRPLGRADFTRMSSDVLGSLDFAQQIGGIATDALGRDLESLDHALRIDDERAAIGQTLCFAHDFEVAGDVAGRVTDHRVLDLADGFRRVVPRLVGEVRISRHRIDFDAKLLEFSVMVGHVAQLGRADEGEVGRIEKEHGPLVLDVRVGHLDELAVLVGTGFERLDGGIDDRHSDDPMS